MLTVGDGGDADAVAGEKRLEVEGVLPGHVRVEEAVQDVSTDMAKVARMKYEEVEG